MASDVEITQAVNRCTSSDFPQFFCIERIDEQSDLSTQFVGDGFMHTSPAMSPDGNLIAAVVSPMSFQGPVELNLYSSDGTLIEQTPLALAPRDISVANLV